MIFKQALLITFVTLPMIGASINCFGYTDSFKQWAIGGPVYINSNETVEETIEWGKKQLRAKCEKSGGHAYETAWTHNDKPPQTNYVNLYGICGTDPDGVVAPSEDFLVMPSL